MSSPHETVLCRYHYDPLDRVVSASPKTTAKSQHFYCKSRITTQIQGVSSRSFFQHDDQLFAQQQNDGLTVGTTLLVTDPQRSVLSTVTTKPHEPIAYSPYGHRPANSGLLSLLAFNGEPRDPVTGCYLLGNGYRAFNPVLMRFSSPDSWSPFGDGGLNSYSYCSGDPINRTDPTGHAGGLFGAIALSYRNKRIDFIANKGISKIPPKMRAKRAGEIRTDMNRMLAESDTLEVALIQTKRVKPLAFTDPDTTIKNFNELARTGIPLDADSIPNPGFRSTTKDSSGPIHLDTRFHDAAINHYYQMANSPAPLREKVRMQQLTGKALIARSEYIRKHGLGNIEIPPQ